MKITAVSRAVHVSPRKVRLVADAVRGMALADVLSALTITKKRAAKPVLKTLQSAMANAKHNVHLEMEDLRIAALEVTEGPAMKRYHPSTRGRIHPYKKRTSNIRVILETAEEKQKEKRKEDGK